MQRVAPARAVLPHVALWRRERGEERCSPEECGSTHAESVYRGASTSSQRKWHEMSLAAIFTKYWQCLMNCEGSKEPSRQPAIPGALASVLQDARSFFAGQCTRRLGHIAARGHHKPRAHTLSCEDLAKTKAKPSSIKKNGVVTSPNKRREGRRPRGRSRMARRGRRSR